MKSLSLRTILFLAFVSVIVTTSLFSTFIGVHFIGKSIVPRIQDKVKLDLNSAREILHGAVIHVEEVVHLTAERFFLREALEIKKVVELVPILEKIRQKQLLDILTITDVEGKIILRARNPKQSGYFPQSKDLVAEVLSLKKAVSSIELLSREELFYEGEDLAKRAYTKRIPTPHARVRNKSPETSGLCILAGAPIFSDQGATLGILWGGKLLNHDSSIVERVKGTVSENQKYRGRDVCAVTIFLDDVRISTNLKNANGERAVGTMVSEDVYNHVFVSGEKWLKRAFEVDDWYIKAYEPIKNISGTTIGILGVGMLEGKFKDMQRHALWIFLGITLGGIALSVVICSLLTRMIMKPISSLVKATENLASGNREYSVALKHFPEEITVLGRAFNSLAIAINKRDEQLRRQAQEEIRRSERLAMIGRLASGVAHEINNPLGSILLFTRLLLQGAPVEGLQRDNLERIERETRRCQNIVQGLLEFARKREPKVEEVNINDAVDKTIQLFENQAMFHNIEVVKQSQPDLPTASADLGQIMQVFANIIMNAVDAMNGHGVLTIRTALVEAQRCIEIGFSDTGCGVPPEELDKVFEPFYTTKGVGQGTGLGLSVSHGIIQAHGGTIKVHSRVTEGTTFVVSLPIWEEKT